MCSERKQGGFTLIEMVVAIVVLGVGVTGVMVAYSNSVRGSSDALITKQLVAIAEEMMEEILLKPYAPPTGSAGAGATGVVVACGSAAASRESFDEVSDYNGYRTADVCGVNGALIAGLQGYAVAVTVTNTTYSGVTNALLVQVTATRGGQAMTLDGIRTDYARLP